MHARTSERAAIALPTGGYGTRQVGESKVIAGWHQGLIGMKKGTKRFLVIGAGMTALVEA